MIKPTGKVFYKDEYDQFYDVQWETVNGLIDITTIIKQPYVWGEEPQGYVKNGIVFRLGIVTVERQIIRVFDGGYEIVAEGASQVRDYIQMNFPCETGPLDNFRFHFNCGITDETVFKVTEGPHWADPDDPEDSDAVWGTVDSDGSSGELTTTGGAEPLEWIDVWT